MKALIAAGLFALAPMAQAETPTLTVYTYDSFVADWGPGPAVKKAFEPICHCTLNFVATGDGAALLSRIKLEGAHTKADVVLGLDTSLTGDAAATGLFAPHGPLPKLDLPVKWDDPVFVPFDWGWFAFVYDKTKVKDVPHSFPELAKSNLKVVIEDPRSSTPGLGLLYWVKAAYGDKAGDIWKSLAPRILTVTPSWDEAYGMFTKGEADMVLSYTTSPAYHLIEEKDASKAAAIFDEGNYMEVEVAAKLKSSPNQALADEFLAFMDSDAFQSIIPETNWMYPAVTPKDGLPKGFDDFRPAKTLLLSAEQAKAVREKALAEWQAALSR